MKDPTGGMGNFTGLNLSFVEIPCDAVGRMADAARGGHLSCIDSVDMIP